MMKIGACFVLFVMLPLNGLALITLKPTGATESPKIVDYNLNIKEGETVFDEKVEIDEEKQTEVFKVPAHNGAEEIQVLNDFKMKLTMLRNHIKKICYLMPLDKEVPTPRQLKKNFDQVLKTPYARGVRVEKTSVSVGKEVTDRTVLSDELALFCAKYPIFHLNTFTDPTVVNITKTAEKSAEHLMRERRSERYRRQTDPACILGYIKDYPGLKLCQGKMCQVQANAVCQRNLKTPILVCKKTGFTCNYMLRCNLVCPGSQLLCPDNCKWAGPNSGRGQCTNKCFNIHYVINRYCCHWICS